MGGGGEGIGGGGEGTGGGGEGVGGGGEGGGGEGSSPCAGPVRSTKPNTSHTGPHALLASICVSLAAVSVLTLSDEHDRHSFFLSVTNRLGGVEVRE